MPTLLMFVSKYEYWNLCEEVHDNETITSNIIKGDSAFPWISAQPLLEPLLNKDTTSYMSVITYLHRGLMTMGGQIPIQKLFSQFPTWPNS